MCQNEMLDFLPEWMEEATKDSTYLEFKFSNEDVHEKSIRTFILASVSCRAGLRVCCCHHPCK